MKRVGALGLFAVLGMSSSAFAHIQLMVPTPRVNNPMGQEQKTASCGSPGYSRAANPTLTTVYPPGAQVMVQWIEAINHTSHYRIAFQPNGETFSNPPAGTGVGLFPDTSQAGMTDGATGTMILADLIPDATHEMMITLPTTECTNCTLQLIQVMKDTVPYGPEDLYFNCADITIQAGAPMPEPMPPDAGVGGMEDAGTGGTGGTNEVTGGCSTSGGSSTALFGLALLAGVRRRRR